MRRSRPVLSGEPLTLARVAAHEQAARAALPERRARELHLELRLLGAEPLPRDHDHHLSERVMDGKEPLTPGEEGLRDMKLIMAVYEAAKSGRTVRV